MSDKITHEMMQAMSLAELGKLLNKQINLKQRLADKAIEIRVMMGTYTTNIHNIRRRIAMVSPANEPVEICDHAIVRYLERVKGIDMEAIKAEMDSPNLRESVKHAPTDRHILNGIVYAVERGTLVSVWREEGLEA